VATWSKTNSDIAELKAPCCEKGEGIFTARISPGAGYCRNEEGEKLSLGVLTTRIPPSVVCAETLQESRNKKSSPHLKKGSDKRGREK